MERSIYNVPVAVIGASLGGVQATLSLLEENREVFMSEESAWIGGQLTSQAVPPDEHPWIEEFGCTAKYRNFRQKIREAYRQSDSNHKKIPEGPFDPGNSTVSRLSHMPHLAHRLLCNSLEEYGDRLTLKTGYRPHSAKVENDIIKWVRLINKETGEIIEVRAEIFIDATDQGDLLPLTNTAYRFGAESQKETGEPSAPVMAVYGDIQPVTWVLSLGLDTGESPIVKPKDYHHFLSLTQPYDYLPLFSRFGPDGSTGKSKEFGILDEEEDPALFSLWSYRRIQYPPYHGGNKTPELSLLNWPQNDYFLGNIIENDKADFHFSQAREFSFSFLYWLQTEAPRPGGKKGYPEIGLVRNVLGTEDGAAQFPYIREGRRIKALTTVREQDISAQYNESLPVRVDSVGVGSYPIDLHITTKTHTFYYKKSVPFQIPLGMMIPEKTKNLITASKNSGTTHITNGCFRLHPVEWNMGEAAGYLSWFCLKYSSTPREIRRDKLKEFQDYLCEKGVELSWPSSLEGVWL